VAKKPPEKRRCAWDGCCEFVPHSWNHYYCRECGCKRKAENAARRQNDDAKFEQPREFKELPIRSAPDGYKVLIINDLHRPFHDVASLTAIEHFWADFKPDLEIYNGDIADFYCISNYDKNPSRRFHLQDEMDDTAAWLERRAKANPSARRIFIDGNHEDRLRRWLWRHGTEVSSLRALTVEEQLKLKDSGFEHLDYMSVVNLLSFRIEHGYKATASKAYPVNVSRWMAIATGSSGLCGHTHHHSKYSWTDSRGSHSYIENGCVCRLDMDYAPFPNWQHGFCTGVVHRNKIHLSPVLIYPDGFRAENEFYERG